MKNERGGIDTAIRSDGNCTVTIDTILPLIFKIPIGELRQKPSPNCQKGDQRQHCSAHDCTDHFQVNRCPIRVVVFIIDQIK